jgi:aspartyl/asparaginyl beta-hydroxylase (cupin superfamily)
MKKGRQRLRSYINHTLDFLSPLGWLNAFFDRYTGAENRSAFFDIDKTAPALNSLALNYAEIKQELESILRTQPAMPDYHELDLTQLYVSRKLDRDKAWKVFMLYAMGERWEANRALCPRTCTLLNQIPGLFQAFFSILEAGKSIPGHRGSYRGYLRYHLALRVPKTAPPSLRVKDQWYVWKEGEAILFDDSLHHEVVNKADEDRIVLIVDVLRPMPSLPQAVNRLFTRTVVRYVYAKGVFRLSPFLWRLSRTVSRAPRSRRNSSME